MSKAVLRPVFLPAVFFIHCFFPLAVDASTIGARVAFSETVTFSDVISRAIKGNPENATRSANLVGGFLANSIRVDGILEEIDADTTFGNEADISIVAPGGSVIVNGSDLQDYTGIITSPATRTPVIPGFDPAGLVGFEFYESFDDDEDDQRWVSVNITFEQMVDTVENGHFALGYIPKDGRSVVGPGAQGNNYHSHVDLGSAQTGGVDFFTFNLPVGIGEDGYLNIRTVDAGTLEVVDTEIFLFDSTGNFIAHDDDGGNSPTYSMFSFGVADPYTGGVTNPGDDGLELHSGRYTLAIRGVLTEPLPDNINGLGPGDDKGDYQIEVRFFSNISDEMCFPVKSVNPIAVFIICI